LTLEENTFARLRVVDIGRQGAFLDWGQPKDLFLPAEEQTREIFVGEVLVVFLHTDFTGRPAASMRLENFVEPIPASFRNAQRFRLWILEETALGFKVLMDERWLGVLYHSEIFKPLRCGDEVTGYLKKVREDGKVDLMLQPPGIQGRDDVGRQILEKLEAEGGFLRLTEKSDPELIYRHFGVSKKQFKMALGGLYRQRLVDLEADGIRLLKG
jgi:predicted RNA-binding protein (virulence factor B family)